MPPEIGGPVFDKNGNLYACLRRGDVLVTKPVMIRGSTEWKCSPRVCIIRRSMELSLGPHHRYPDGRVYRNY